MGGEGPKSLPVGVEGEHIEDDLDDGNCNPDRHEQGNGLVAPGVGAVEEAHDYAQLS